MPGSAVSTIVGAMLRDRSLLSLLMVLAFPAPLLAQGDSTHAVRGVVRDSAGKPVKDADVFLLATLEGAPTDSAGRFLFRTAARGTATIVARKIGFTPLRLDVTLPLTEPLTLTLHGEAVALEEITVSAGTYIAGEERGAQLTPLEVATTPGTTADIGRTIQTLPGVQSVDEGNALFVRGGDYLETKVFVNDALLLNGFRYDSPTGTFSNTPNAFLLDGIFFSSGGFGARFGNALSGVVSLRTLGRPAKSTGTLSVGLAALSAAGAWAAGPTLGFRGTLTRFSTRPIFWLNGTPRDYHPAPNGSDASVSAVWSYRSTGEFKFFAINQQSRLGLTQDLPTGGGTYTNRSSNSVGILSWHDVFGNFSQTASLAVGARRQGEGFGDFNLDVDSDLIHLFTYAGYDASDRLTLRAGGEWEHVAGRFSGKKGLVIDSRATDDRLAAFVEGDWRVTARVKVTPGLRTDRSHLSAQRSWDPRLAAAWLVGAHATVTLAAGTYHQVPEPLFFDALLGRPGLPPMRADQLVGGFQLGEGERILRIEAYGKRYHDLAQMDRDNRVVSGGTGTSHGLDFFLKGEGPWRVKGRMAYSYIRARRTDPNSGTVAPAPADITHAVTLVLERPITQSTNSGIAVHYATGRPYTEVLSADFDPGRNAYVPTFGPPMGSRVPVLFRIDANLSRIVSLGPKAFVVLYASVNNLLDRKNIYQYTYTRDYTQRIEVPSLFNRSFYFGATLSTR